MRIRASNVRQVLFPGLWLLVVSSSGSLAQQVQVGPPTFKPLAERPVIGALAPGEVNWKLAQIGAITAEKAAENQQKIRMNASNYNYAISIRDLLGIHGQTPVWAYTTHQFGYIPLLSAVGQSSPIRITLDRLRVAQYPGGGRHKILFTFQTQNQVAGGTPEDVVFSQDYEVLEGQGAGIAGFPIFVGLHVPAGGLGLQCHTTNVSNDGDEKVISFLNGSTFQSGLKLLESANPAVPIVAGFATGLLHDFESRNENVGVEDFYLGLDFVPTPSGARLAQGSYISVQAPDEGWNWGDWVFDVAKGQVVSKADGRPIQYNYVVFSIQKL
jgi:hypothetical protein